MTRAAGGDHAGWIDSRPSILRNPDFAPGMGVGLVHEKESAQVIVFAAQIADHDARGNSGQPHQSSETGSVMLAKAGATMKEKFLQIVLVVFARCQRIAKSLVPKKLEGSAHGLPWLGIVCGKGCGQLTHRGTNGCG